MSAQDSGNSAGPQAKGTPSPRPTAPASGLVFIDTSWKLEVDREHYETAGAWANVRIVKDPRRGDEYIDLVTGVKGKDPHSHYGFNRDGSVRFDQPRGRIHSIHREAVDSSLGKVDDKTMILKPEKGKNTFQLRIYADAPSRTVRVALEESGFTPS